MRWWFKDRFGVSEQTNITIEDLESLTDKYRDWIDNKGWILYYTEEKKEIEIR